MFVAYPFRLTTPPQIPSTRKVRPFLYHTIIQLKDLARIHWRDPATLVEIHRELTFRNRKKPQRLRAVIEAQLIAISEESFPWPTTAIVPQKGAFSRSHWDYQQGMLSFLGYSVGHNGLAWNQRRSILDYTFHEQLPVVQSIEYTRQWSIPKSGLRLRKLASCIASLCRSGTRRDEAGYADMSCACAEWTEDLEYLRTKYYVGKFDFSWPSTAV